MRVEPSDSVASHAVAAMTAVLSTTRATVRAGPSRETTVAQSAVLSDKARKAAEKARRKAAKDARRAEKEAARKHKEGGNA